MFFDYGKCFWGKKMLLHISLTLNALRQSNDDVLHVLSCLAHA